MELDRALRRLGLEVRGNITKAETHCSGLDVGVEVGVMGVLVGRRVVSDPFTDSLLLYICCESRELLRAESASTRA